ncbi:MAG: hypothetical protein CM1200mP29_14440 [Verrucomicrobiota bacterium]|nr:MAG: hypothetical protein CM1200mP29_14440 [Verrucomicrobiota bacterium]
MGLGRWRRVGVVCADLLANVHHDEDSQFLVMGGVFLGLGFVYTRYHEQLKKLL